jgi:hypothetical protein
MSWRFALSVVPRAGIEPARPLFTKAADFKSDVSTNFTTGAKALLCLQVELFDIKKPSDEGFN